MAHIIANEQQELKNCTFVKALLMLSVVFYHSILFWTGNWLTRTPVLEAPVLGLLAQWLNTFHIYAFTLVSGYLFYYLKQEQGKYQQFGVFLSTKIKRLLGPFYFVVLIWVSPINYLWSDFEITSAVEKYILGTGPDQLWFLLMLFNVFMFIWPLSDFLTKHDFLSVMICVVFYGIGLVGNILTPNYFQIWSSCQYVIFFVLGFKIRQHGSWLLMRIPWFVWVISSILLFAIDKLLPSCGSIIYKLLSLGISVAVNIVGAIMAFVVFQKIAAKIPYQTNRLISCFIKYSMPIYLFHQQFIYIFIALLNGIVDPYLNAAVNFIGALLLSLSLSVVLVKFPPTRFLVGEK